MISLRFLKQAFSSFLHQAQHWFNPPYKTSYVEGDLPKNLKRKIIYIVKEDNFAEHAAMMCPCGCGKILYMNLLPDERPCWRVTEHSDRTVSLHPSVWRQKDCGSHFWFRKGRVHWCNGSN